MSDRTRHLGHIIALLAILITVSSAPAQEVASDDPYAADRAELLKLKDQYEAAIQTGELGGLEGLIAEGFYGVMVTGHRAGSFDELKDYWAHIREQMGEDGTYEVEVLPEPALFSGNHAISHGTTKETVTASGNTYQFESLWTAVFVKEADGWKILRLHASMDPINNTFVHTWRRQAITWSVLIGAVAGCVLGGVFVGIIQRRRAK